MNTVVGLLILIMLLFATGYDVRTGKIPNGYTGFWLAIGLVLRLVSGGGSCLRDGIVGVIIPVAGLMALFAIRVLGAGDIKLMAAVGAFLGADVIWMVIYSFILCGLYGVGLIIGRLVSITLHGDKEKDFIGVITRNRQYTRVAFSVFVLGGFVWYLLKGGWWLGI